MKLEKTIRGVNFNMMFDRYLVGKIYCVKSCIQDNANHDLLLLHTDLCHRHDRLIAMEWEDHTPFEAIAGLRIGKIGCDRRVFPILRVSWVIEGTDFSR